MESKEVSPADLASIGRFAQQIREGRFDEGNPGIEKYQTPVFVKIKPVDNIHVSVDITDLANLISSCMDRRWIGCALGLFGDFCHDLLYYIKNPGSVAVKIRDETFLLSKRGVGVVEQFTNFLDVMRLTELREVKHLTMICSATTAIADKVHLRTVLVMFADLPSLFIPWTPVKLNKVLGSGGQRTIFEIRTKRGEFYALRPDTRDKELERMFVCLEALDSSHIFHIFEACDYDDGRRDNGGRCHLFMPVMYELETFFTRDRLYHESQHLITLVHHTALQLHAMDANNVVHRDVKPANILVYFDNHDPTSKEMKPNSKPFFYLTDFGWSCEKGIETGTSVGGTKQYRDPYMYVLHPHPKFDIWGLGLAVLVLVNRITENNPRASMVRKIKQWQESLLVSKSEGHSFTVQDFTKWLFQWERMALGSPLDDPRRFRVGTAAMTADFRDLLRGCLELRWDHRWSANKVLHWTRSMAEKHGLGYVISQSSFRLAQKDIGMRPAE